MGKAAKAKKRRNKAAPAFFKNRPEALTSTEISSDASGDDDSDAEVDGDAVNSDAVMSIRLLNVLGRRLDIYESKPLKHLRTALFPLVQLQISKGSHFETNIVSRLTGEKDSGDELVNRKVSVLLRTAAAYASNHDLFLSPDSKPFRAAMHPLVVMQQRRMSNKPGVIAGVVEASQSYSARVSSAFRCRDWPLALRELYGMSMSNEAPKLGALQRWVRECDFALHQSKETTAKHDTADSAVDRKNTSLLLLDAVMRVAVNKSLLSHSTVKKDLPVTAVIHHYQMAEESANLTTGTTGASETTLHADLQADLNLLSSSSSTFRAERVTVVSHVPGAQRRPPSESDLNIFSMTPRSISFESGPPPVRVDVDKVPGTFLMQNVLSSKECSQLIAAAEAIGYSHDAVEGIDNIVLFADDSLLAPIFERCRHLLPQRGLVGINSRFRFFRYREGAVYRPHIDGSWPGSGMVDGEYVDDAFGGERNSKLTFLMYLNGDEEFNGGSTTFFLPGEERGHIEARAVHPQRGAVLVFPHGEVSSPVHEGSHISEGGRKYVIRTDVLYSTADATVT